MGFRSLVLICVLGTIPSAFAFQRELSPRDIPEPKVRHGHNAAKIEKANPVWQLAANQVHEFEKHGYAVLPDMDPPSGKLIRGNRNERILSLTFDDGPHPIYTEALLKILKKERVPGTFFVVGKMAARYPELVKEIVAQGQDIGNHTFSHVTLTDIRPDEVATEYEADNEVIFAASGHRPKFCRPPGGRYDDHVVRIGQKLGMTTALWTDDPGDYEKIAEADLEKKTLSKISNGAIILLHSGVPQTLEMLPKIIKYAHDRGFKFVTLAEMEASLHREGPIAVVPKPSQAKPVGHRR